MNFNDDIFRLLQAFIDENQHNYASVDETVEAFMAQYHEKLAKEGQAFQSEEMSKEEESMLLLQESQLETDRARSRKLLKQALKLWPDNFEAEMLLVEGDFTEQLKAFSKLEQRERAKWLKSDQSGWVNFEERPYWRLKHAYADFLFDIGLLTEAEAHYEESLTINEMDQLGARYSLMSVYARTYQWDKAMDLFEQIPNAFEDDQMLVPLLCLAVLTRNDDFAYELLAALKRANSELKQLFKDDTLPIDLIMASGTGGHYTFNSLESLCVAFYPLVPMLFGAEYVYLWLKKAFLNKGKRTQPVKKVNFGHEADIIKFPGKHVKATEPLEGILGQARNILEAAGLTSFEAFEKVTEEDVRSIKGIGPRTMRLLKDNRVTFKK